MLMLLMLLMLLLLENWGGGCRTCLGLGLAVEVKDEMEIRRVSNISYVKGNESTWSSDK